MQRKLIWGILFLSLLTSLHVNGENMAEDQWIVQLHPSQQIDDLISKFKNNSPKATASLNYRLLSSANHIFLVQGVPLKQLDIWKSNGAILNYQIEEPIEFRRAPNDPNLELQWGVERLGLEEVWSVTTGGITANGDTIVVAILDEGFDVEHADLMENIWINRAEIPFDEIDNDGNGYVDDIQGWNFSTDNPIHTISQHGVSVAGIVGAKGDNEIGVAGINWNVKLMLFTIRSVSDIIASYDYIIEQRQLYNTTEGQKGAFVVATNASFGNSGRFCEEQPIWGGMYDKLGNVGVLTGAGTANNNWNVDFVGDMPTSCESDFILTTLNVNQEDQKHVGSAFGNKSIDLGSPGEDSYTTKPFNLYGFFSSNSAAAPHLTGTIALLYAAPCRSLARDALTNPKETALYIRSKIIGHVEPIADLEDKTVTGGRLSASNSFNAILDDCTSTLGDLAIQSLTPNPVLNQINIRYETPTFDQHEILITNVLGQVLHKATVIPPEFGAKRLVLNVDFLNRGTYIFSIRSQHEIASSKFLKL